MKNSPIPAYLVLSISDCNNMIRLIEEFSVSKNQGDIRTLSFQTFLHPEEPSGKRQIDSLSFSNPPDVNINNPEYRKAKAKIYIAIGKASWGKATTLRQAQRNARKEMPRGMSAKDRTLKCYEAHPETRVFGDGSWEYPQGHEPRLLSKAELRTTL